MSEQSARRIGNIVGHLAPSISSSSSLVEFPASSPVYEVVKIERKGAVAIVTLNRQGAMNALSRQLTSEIVAGLVELDNDDSVGCIVITGVDKAFAAGADIKEMTGMSTVYHARFKHDTVGLFSLIEKIKKPIIAAVNGVAFGGGCELAMMADIIIAGDNAKFGQPEIKIGTIPGLGGTQRLTHAVGKSKAMEMVLTGNPITAKEAEAYGLVSRVVASSETVNEAVKLASQIASLSQPIVAIAKEAVNVAYEVNLAEGLRFERRAFQTTFAFKDRAEGMSAFKDKRKPAWSHS
eukprot:TRINITY_DN584_c0_g2_i1.p1 TRINITY_DN584_c0_g2~~TRINITY_DN584_c0_g2_i1.p1  ORF type:complete len:304 (-),score=113.01 TRINITY_DN584_c0_g2_i1:31-909(-)